MNNLGSHKDFYKVDGIKFDISKKKNLVKNLSHDYDYIINLAGYVDHSHKEKTMRSHYDGCKNLSMFFLNKKIEKFIQVGSSIEYGKLKSPQKENIRCNTQSVKTIYGKAKLLSTKYLISSL